MACGILTDKELERIRQLRKEREVVRVEDVSAHQRTIRAPLGMLDEQRDSQWQKVDTSVRRLCDSKSEFGSVRRDKQRARKAIVAIAEAFQIGITLE